MHHIQASSAKLSLESLHRLRSLQGAPDERSTLGFLLRDMDVHDPVDALDWRMSVLHALILEIAVHPGQFDGKAAVLELANYVFYIRRYVGDRASLFTFRAADRRA